LRDDLNDVIVDVDGLDTDMFYARGRMTVIESDIGVLEDWRDVFVEDIEEDRARMDGIDGRLDVLETANAA
jgi:hypothetical protein